jgi:hypothetical protein
MSGTTRRRLMGVAVGTGLQIPIFAGSKAAAQPGGTSPAPGPATVRIRRNIYGLDPAGTEIVALRRGITAMQRRRVDDPTSWLFQANIHGTVDPVPPGSAARVAGVWQTCQHGTFFFLSWHRMYLNFFERILRAASGSAAFTLPYWDYSNSAQRALPVAFRQPAAASNPLFVAQRSRRVNGGEPLPPSAVESAAALAFTNFASPLGSGNAFGGQRVPGPQHFAGPHGALESRPHDVVHVAVGGQGGWMTDPDLAARDPIFWLHHANIDRLWSRWLAQGGGRSNPTGDQTWMGQRFTFYDERTRRVQLSGADVVDAARQLGYRYDDEAVPMAGALVAAASPGAGTEAAPSRVLAALPPTESGISLGTRDVRFALQPAQAGATESAAPPGRGPVVLRFEEIAFRQPVGIYYEVYVNQPEGARPDPQGPGFAGTLSLFGVGHGRARGVTGGIAEIDITGLLARQREQGLWSGGEIRVFLRPVGAEETTETAPARPLATVGRVRVLGQ